jgi:hypothetical protein
MKNDSCHVARLVVWFLGINGLLLSGGVLFLSYTGQPIDAAVFTLAGTAIGALGSLLTNTQARATSRGDDAQPVTVTNTPETPVPVTSEG